MQSNPYNGPYNSGAPPPLPPRQAGGSNPPLPDRPGQNNASWAVYNAPHAYNAPNAYQANAYGAPHAFQAPHQTYQAPPQTYQAPLQTYQAPPAPATQQQQQLPYFPPPPTSSQPPPPPAQTYGYQPAAFPPPPPRPPLQQQQYSAPPANVYTAPSHAPLLNHSTTPSSTPYQNPPNTTHTNYPSASPSEYHPPTTAPPSYPPPPSHQSYTPSSQVTSFSPSQLQQPVYDHRPQQDETPPPVPPPSTRPPLGPQHEYGTSAQRQRPYYPPPPGPPPQAKPEPAPSQQEPQTITPDRTNYAYPPPPPPVSNETPPKLAHNTASDVYYFAPPPTVSNKPAPQVSHDAGSDIYYLAPRPPVPSQEQQPASSHRLREPLSADPPVDNLHQVSPPRIPLQRESTGQTSEQPSISTIHGHESSSGSLPQPQHLAQQDPLQSLSTQMQSLAVNQEKQRGPPPISASGTPSDIIPWCPETRAVDYPLNWYILKDVPECLICTRCHADHITGTSLASEFVLVKEPEGPNLCKFWRPRVKDVLWPLSLQRGTVDDLRAFLKKRDGIPDCKARLATNATDSLKWFGMLNEDINGFLACEACYEDHVLGTPFETKFGPYRQQGPEEKWVCDLSLPYISLSMGKISKQNDWSGFIAAATVRVQLPMCEGVDVELNSRNWYSPRREIKDMHVCEACYLDKLALTRFANDFTRYDPGTGFDAFLERLGQRWTCSLADRAIPMAVALEAALYQRNFSVFWNAAEAITRLVPCTANGIIRGNWRTLVGGCDGFNVCEACYAGILVVSGLDQFFERTECDPSATIVCNFCPASPRFMPFLSKYAEALDKGVFSYYTTYVKRWVGVPACPGIKTLGKATWWGYPEALFCQDCYLDFVSETSLAESIPVKGVYDERHQCCQIWSPRMRKMWLEVCEAGDPGSPESEAALTEFRAFGTRRLEVYLATVPQIEMIREMKNMRMMNAMHQGMLSVMYQGMNSFAAVSGTTDGYLHGSSSLGWYETEHGATSAQMRNNMSAGMADANRADEWMQIAQLQTIWKEVE